MTTTISSHVRYVPDYKITEPGIYADIPIDVYHTQLCDSPSLSSTAIRRIILGSPAEFWKYSPLNPDHVEEDEKEAFILGRAAHHLLLGEANFQGRFIVRPEYAPDGSAWNGNKTICRKWIADRQLEGLTVLTPSQMEQVKGMAGILPWQKGMVNCGLLNTPIVAEAGALSGEIERSIFWKATPRTWLKCRPDAIPGTSNDFSDLKTIGRGGIDYRFLSMANYEHGYFIQGALVGMGVEAVLGRTMTGFHNVFVEADNVHAVSVRTIDDADLARGRRAVDLAVQMFERCMDTGIWPGPTAHQADAMKLSIPVWAAERFDKHLEFLAQSLEGESTNHGVG